jgi:hypothetical protein
MRLFIGVNSPPDEPIFNGTAVFDIKRYRRRISQAIADEGVRLIRAYLPTQYMYLGHHGGDPHHNPVPPNAGELAASIVTDRVRTDRVLIRGDMVTYGAWIEGIDDRNLIVWPGRLRRGLSGRFPGYHTFRIIRQVLDERAKGIAERELPRYLKEIND